MKKINVKSYNIEINGEEGIIQIPYDVKASLKNVLFHPEQKLDSARLMEHARINNIIEKCDGNLLLEERDYTTVKTSIESITGYNETDIEFVNRIIYAEDVEVKEV